MRIKFIKIWISLSLIFVIVIAILGYREDVNTCKILSQINIEKLNLKYVISKVDYSDKDFKEGIVEVFDPKILDNISKMMRSAKPSRFLSTQTADYRIHLYSFDEITQKEFNLRMHYKYGKYLFSVNSSNMKFRNDPLGIYIERLLLKE